MKNEKWTSKAEIEMAATKQGVNVKFWNDKRAYITGPEISHALWLDLATGKIESKGSAMYYRAKIIPVFCAELGV